MYNIPCGYGMLYLLYNRIREGEKNQNTTSQTVGVAALCCAHMYYTAMTGVHVLSVLYITFVCIHRCMLRADTVNHKRHSKQNRHSASCFNVGPAS